MLLALVLPGGLYAAEKASQQVSPFLGSFSYSVPIEVPPYHGLEPRLALGYSSEGRNGFLGVGWDLSGFSIIERTNPGRGSPLFDATDIHLLDGQELVPCQQGSVSPSCTSGGTHSTKIESYLKIKATPSTNPTTWEVWGKDGTKTTFTSVFTVPPSSWLPGGTLRWGQTSTVDTYGNTVTYAWACQDGDCYPDKATYNGYEVVLYRETTTRPDVVSFAAATTIGETKYRLRSVLVRQAGGTKIRAYKLSYSPAVSPVTGRSLLASVQQYGKDVTIDSAGLITGGTSLPAQTFTWHDDALGKTYQTPCPRRRLPGSRRTWPS